MLNKKETEYASFGQRFLAMIIDNITFSIVLSPIFMMLFNSRQYTDTEIQTIIENQGLASLIDPKELLIQQSIILSITILFWILYAGTPGKLILRIKIVDAETGNKLSIMQSLVRYLGYFISTIPMGMGFLWIFKDKRNQGWHDKLANSVVIKSSKTNNISNKTNKNDTSDNDKFAA